MNARSTPFSSLFLALALALSVSLAACGGGGSTASDLGGTDPGTSLPDTTEPDPGTDPGTTPPDEGPGDPGQTCSDECPVAGQRECVEGGVRECDDANVDGCLEWGVPVACGTGQKCVGGQCKLDCPDLECTVVGAKKCMDGTTVQECGDFDANGCLEWGADKACDGGLVCTNGFCKTSCEDACTILGAKKCDMNDVVTCGDYDSNGCLEWGEPKDCDAQVCVGGFCKTECSDECLLPGAKKCDGNGVVTCDDLDGDSCLTWGTTVPCGETQVCSNGTCADTCSNECTVDGAKKCVLNSVAACSDSDTDGCLEWGSPVPCAEGQICNEGACETQCKSECTVKGASKCDEAGSVTQCVDSDGQGCLKWGAPYPCEAPLVCSQGTCQLTCSDECAAKGDRRCAEGSQTRFEVCDEYDADGCLEWGTSQACEGALVCSAGDCVTTCSDECPASGDKVCDGNGHKACGDPDQDGCLEWGTVTFCSAGYECKEGACAEIPTPVVFISEVLYDSPSSPDKDSFVEIRGPADLDLEGWILVGVNGNDGKDYNTISLSGHKIGSDGFFVVAHPSANATVHAASDLDDSSVDYQNGPDSIQLRYGTKVVDAIAYGTFASDEFPAGEGTPAKKTSTAGHSLARDEAGTDTDDNLADFSEFAVPTPGAANVIANKPPVAHILCPAGGKAGDYLTFDASASVDEDGTIANYEFDFGDGGNHATGAYETAQYFYLSAGSYQVTVVVTDDDGATAQASCNIAIESAAGNEPPTAAIICPTGGKAGQDLLFDASGSTDADGSIVLYTFAFGDGVTAKGTTATATYKYAAAGTYDVTVDIEDDLGATARASCKVTIAPAGFPDKTISASTELCGEQRYGKLVIQGGAKVTCATGAIDIAADEVFIDPASGIDVSGKGLGAGTGGSYSFCTPYCFCDPAYTGGSGGGNATFGVKAPSNSGSGRSPEMGGCLGSCVQFGCASNAAGASQGSSTELDAPAGGAGGTSCASGFSSCSGVGTSSKGGGSVRIIASKSLEIQGSILANGVDGAKGTAGGGGGAGGSIVLVAPTLKVSGTLATIPGQGGAGSKPGGYYSVNANGGAGASGRIKLVHGTDFVNTASISGATVVDSVMPPIVLASSTHPDAELAYNDTFTEFKAEWTAPFTGIQGYWYALNTSMYQALTPTNGTYTTATSVTLPASTFTKAGDWYFHVVTTNGQSVTGTVASRVDVHVNSTPHTVTSSSHPNQNAWYTGKAVALAFAPPADADAASFPAFWYRLDRNSTLDPATAKTSWTRTTNSQVVITTDADGNPLGDFAYYFHVVAEDTMGNLTKAAAHYRIQLGTEPAKMNYFGYVKEGATAVQGVTVRLEPYGMQTTTDTNGYFILNDAYVGTYTLTAKKAGYKDTVLTVTVKADQVPVNVAIAK